MNNTIIILCILAIFGLFSPTVSAQWGGNAEWCYGYTVPVTCTGTATNVDPNACMESAVNSCTESCMTQVEELADDCPVYCLNRTLEDGGKWCGDVTTTYTMFSCNITDVQWVQPGTFSCLAEGSTTFSCDCWHNPLPEQQH